MNKQATNWTLLAVLLVVWGLGYPIVKFGLVYSPPAAFTFYRTLIGTLSSVPLVISSIRSKKVLVNFRNLRFLSATLLFGLTGTVFFLGFWYTGAALVDPGIAAVIIYTYPIFIVLLSVLFLSEKLSLLRIVGVFAGFVGTFILLTDGNIGVVSINPVGFVLLLGASASSAVSFIVYQKWLTTEDRVSVNVIQLTFSTVLLLVWTLLSDPRSLYARQMINPIFIAVLIFTGVLSTMLAFLILMTLLRNRGSVWLAEWLFLVPVIALFSSVILLSEQIHTAQLAGFAVIIFGIAIVNNSAAKLRKLRTAFSMKHA
ncbi:MAG: DMT family transporter [Nitrososphaerota archaeon]|nr:DMT family transporter [Nitrososphaerota archaeon]MDG6923485.1 DMT family transporter [Nitrososphaerota archaeon]